MSKISIRIMDDDSKAYGFTLDVDSIPKSVASQLLLYLSHKALEGFEDLSTECIDDYAGDSGERFEDCYLEQLRSREEPDYSVEEDTTPVPEVVRQFSRKTDDFYPLACLPYGATILSYIPSAINPISVDVKQVYVPKQAFEEPQFCDLELRGGTDASYAFVNGYISTSDMISDDAILALTVMKQTEKHGSAERFYTEEFCAKDLRNNDWHIPARTLYGREMSEEIQKLRIPENALFFKKGNDNSFVYSFDFFNKLTYIIK